MVDNIADNLTLYLAIWLASAVISGWIAQSKGSTPLQWAVVGLLLGPFGILLTAAFAKPVAKV